MAGVGRESDKRRASPLLIRPLQHSPSAQRSIKIGLDVLAGPRAADQARTRQDEVGCQNEPALLPNNETMSYSKLALSAVALPCANNTSARSLL